MADHCALKRLGWVFGAVTAAVMFTAALIVAIHPDQPAGPGNGRLVAAATQSSASR
jgi:hypothetical protein